MVCLGNICRSPIAEGIMRKLINEAGLDWQIASAGTGNWHVGEAPDKRSIAVAKIYGYDISQQKAQYFNRNFLKEYDLIYAMDKNNLQDILNLAQSKEERNKVALFLSDQEDVLDPYYDNNLFMPICLQIENRCKELLRILTS